MAEGEPLEYILGETQFCGTTIDLSLRPMIPRPETEHWVYQAIQDVKDGKNKTTDNRQQTSNDEQETTDIKITEAHELPKVIRVLDLFSGSGNVGISFLKKIEKCTVDMIEIDSKLKKQIEISLIKNIIDPIRAKILIGDTWDGATGTYDVITAVPPYVPPQMKAELMKELGKEPVLSFFDKEDGYYYHKQILSRAKEFLKVGGVLYLEFDITQREKIEELALGYGLQNFTFIIDPYRHDFVLVYTHKG